MKTTFRKSVIPALLAAAVMTSSVALATSGKVAGGKHDFSVNGGSNTYHDAGNALGGQVCVYCHTPHNAGQTKLLWNKAGNGNTNFRLYTSSGTLTSVTKASVLTSDSPSLLCLSCHDGKTAMNVLHNGGKGITAAAAGLSGYPTGSTLAFGSTPIVMENLYMFGAPVAGLPALGEASGDDLTNDHPIGFSYTAAYTEKQTNSPGNLNAIGTIDQTIVKFYGPNKKMECSTCHDPHIDYVSNPLQTPFLVMGNDGSKLCLTCHNK